MSRNMGLVTQSRNLQSVWAWSLYRVGRFAEATTALQQFASSTDANVRQLRVNIAVASGAWDKLLGFCQETWDDRAQYSASELMYAARISVAVSGPHSRDLVAAAVNREPDNPEILAAAYFMAAKASWEQNTPTVSDWLHRAAELSGDDGRLERISMQEILDEKPKWDKQANDIGISSREARSRLLQQAGFSTDRCSISTWLRH